MLNLRLDLFEWLENLSNLLKYARLKFLNLNAMQHGALFPMRNFHRARPASIQLISKRDNYGPLMSVII